MSRCFPFPPPGYEKARNEDADLPLKEKHKEKKLKRKDREKRDGKEKKDRDRSKDKHREKKDRKEKHKDNKKDKDKNKTSDGKRNEGRNEGCNGQLGESSHMDEKVKDSKLIEELDRRIRDEATGTGSQMVQNFIGTGQRRNEGIGRPMEESERRIEGKDKNKDENKHGDDRRAEKQRDGDEHRGTSSEMVRNISNTDQRRIDGSRPAEKETDKRTEGKEKVNKVKEVDDRRGERPKDREHEEKRSKDKDRDKEKKKEKKVKGHDNHQPNKEQNKFRESDRMEHICKTLNIKSSYPPKDIEKSASSEGNLKKRKEFETNGFIHENDMRPIKLPRPASSSHLTGENGRPKESFSSDRQGANGSSKVEINKEHKVNGTLETRPSSVVPRPSVSVEASYNEASTGPPHPDSKYLSQILTIPKMEEWSDFDNQEWLFGSDHLQSKPKATACNANEMPQVWAETLQIESADVYALPYVIPY